MAVDITPEILSHFENLKKTLGTIECIDQAFYDAPPSVNAEPYQTLFHDAIADLHERFDLLAASLSFPN